MEGKDVVSFLLRRRVVILPHTDPNHPLLHVRLVQSKVGKRVVLNGNDCLYLASHNYLGLLEDEEILEDACKSLRKYGVGSCGPSGIYGTMDVHLVLEDRLAKFMRMEEAVVYSYGFSTVASAIPAYSKKGDIIFVDAAVNFAIQKSLDASRSTICFYKHNDMAGLERLLMQQEQKDRKIFLKYQYVYKPEMQKRYSKRCLYDPISRQ
ncbi:serine palmitoyltransferase 1-like [Glossina fuscipes fuscipes]